MQRTLILLKPDAVQRRLMGRLIARFEDKGLSFVAMKLMKVTPELAKRHYAEHVDKGWYPTLEAFITGGPIVAAVLEGLDAIAVVRGMLGATNGLQAAPGTIRGDFSSSRQMNLVHGSDGADAAEREIALYFSPEELCDDQPTIARWMRAADEA
ncbi:MAG: nucleoside-diphosphate kinase [Planctomycetota bacterium]